MTLFWIGSVAATLAALAVMVLPLARKPKGEAAPARAEFDLAVYKDQLAEIDRDLERGVLNDDQALAARTEIERRMLAAAGDEAAEPTASPETSTANARLTGALLTLLLVTVPLGAFGLYFVLGNPGLADRPFAERSAQSPAPADMADRAAQLKSMIKDIEARIEQEPDNPRAWHALGQAYAMLGDMDNAVGAFRKLVEVTDRHPDALTILGEAMFTQAGDQITPEALKLFMEARTVDPTNLKSYFYGAMAYQQAGDLQRAMDEYAGLLTVSPENGKWVPEIQTRMAALAKELGVETPVVKMLPPVAEAAPPPGPSQQQMQDAQSMSAADQQAMIRSMVDRLATRLKDNPDDLAGWQRLAQAYRVLGDEAGLAEAEAQIKRLSGQ